MKKQDEACTYCGRRLSGEYRSKHEAVCPERSDLRAVILSFLTNPEHPGVAVSRGCYDKRRAGYAGVPNGSTLAEHFPSWPAVAAFFGLAPASSAEGRRVAAACSCPHCGRAFTPSRIAIHTPLCVERAYVRDIVRGLMDGGGAGVGVTNEKYMSLAAAYNATAGEGERAPGVNIVRQHFGEWGNVLAWLGLEAPPHTHSAVDARDDAEAVALAEVAAAIETDRAVRQWESERGLAYCRARPLPNGGVAYVLR